MNEIRARASSGGQILIHAWNALALVPTPRLAIIQTIDSDIRCDGTDDEHVPEFGEQLAAALELITTESPQTEILVVGQLGRPSREFIEELAGP